MTEHDPDPANESEPPRDGKEKAPKPPDDPARGPPVKEPPSKKPPKRAF